MIASRTNLPPVNYKIWVTANNFTWFPIRLMYISDSAHVYKNLCVGSRGDDIAVQFPFEKHFKRWKFELDGSERMVME